MRDVIADWKRWSRVERAVALLAAGLLAALPFGMLLKAATGI